MVGKKLSNSNYNTVQSQENAKNILDEGQQVKDDQNPT